jgi:vacuolar-type H+-ATPase subunit E/Vma4
MSEQDIQDVELQGTEDQLVEQEAQLDEFKASMGDPSEVPEPTATKSAPRKGDKKVEDDPKDAPTAVKVPGTKAGIINAMMSKMNEMPTKQLKASYGKMMAGMKMEDLEVDGEAIEEVQSVRDLPKVTAEDISIAEDVTAMFEGTEDISEGFKEKATVIFETAVVSKVNEQLEKISTNFEAELAEEVESIQKELSENLDSYLDYVVEQWMKDNHLAVEQGLKTEMVEDFLKGLKGLFEDHYVSIPEEKVDVVEELASKTEELESKLNEQIQKNVDLHGVVEQYKRDQLIESVMGDLTESQKAKFETLAEGIDFADEDTFQSKLTIVKESYFGTSEDVTSSYELDDDEPLSEETTEKSVNPEMANYVNAISRSIKK